MALSKNEPKSSPGDDVQKQNEKSLLSHDECTKATTSTIPTVATSAVLVESTLMPEGSPICRGHDFNSTPADVLDAIMTSMKSTGFQATNVALAIDRIHEMRNWRLSDTVNNDPDVQHVKEKIRARIFLAFTSNQISCGQREVIRFLVQNRMVDVLVTTAGGIEEDLIKCIEPTFMGDFELSGRELRSKGINRIGNLLIPNNNYCKFEDWFTPLVHQMHNEQDENMKRYVATLKEGCEEEDTMPELWTPSTIIHRLGKEIDHEDSVVYWAAKNEIPVFCPALTDGSMGDMLYFHSYKRPGFKVDIAADIRRINDLAVQSYCTGQIILGGGLVKHHTCNANMMRNGADYSVNINTAQEFDGSDSGASPDEAISWGKIKPTANPVKVCADASIVWPLIVSQTFAKDVAGWKERNKGTICWLPLEP